MSFIYLIRHGRPEMPDSRTYCIGGSSNPSLCADGRRQARALAQCFGGLDFGNVYCSNLLRSRETTEILADGRWPVRYREDLREINVGLWEGLSFDEIRANYPDIYTARGKDWAISPPGGESLEEAADRLEKAIGEIYHEEGRDLLIVSHDGLIRSLLWRIMALDTKRDAMFRQPYGSITVLEYTNGQLSVTAVGKLSGDYLRT